MIFYLLILLILLVAVSLFFYQRRQNRPQVRRRVPMVNFGELTNKGTKVSEEISSQSPYDPDLIVLQLSAFPGKPYMGYELHQALLSVGLRFGDGNIFHRFSDSDGQKVLFSLAAATKSGSFVVEEMGSFKCNGLLLFMYLRPKRKLMKTFDLMLDIARQLTEELGGEICDDLQSPINAEGIKRLREKICSVETNNLYAVDLLDNLD